MNINAIASVGISLVTVGKKDLTNQNVWTESQWRVVVPLELLIDI